MKKWLDNFGKADNANESNVSLPEDFVGLSYDTSGRNYSPAWGGQFQQGGSIPGSVGFTYARTAGAAPSEGPYAKKTMPSAQNGREMQFYQEGLDWKPKSMQRGGNVIDDYIAYPLLKGTAKAMDYVGDKANDALQYFADLQKIHFYTTYPAGTAKVHRKVNDWLFNNVRPVEYPGILSGIKNVGMGLLNMNEPPEKDSLGLYNIGEEAWQKSLVKTNQPMQSHYIIPSKHRPSDAKDPNTTYYTLKEGVINPQLLIDEANRRNLKVGESAAMTSLAPFIREGFMPEEEFSQIDPIQKFKLSKGKDEKGEYVSIYDKYDFEGPLNSIVTPYEWYDRFYINQPKSKLIPSSPKKKEHGGIVKDNQGYWNPDNWGKMVEIDQPRPDSFIDMTGVYEPLLAVSNKGEERIMYPGERHKFKGSKVTEIPIAEDGKFINQYTINQGDTLSAISKKTGYSVEQLAKANNIEDPDKIYAGQKLTIPYKFDKPLKIKDIPQEHHKNLVIDDYSKSFNYLVQGDKVYYTKKGNDNWVDISDNQKAKGNLYNHLQSKYQMKGYSDYEKSIGKSIADSVYNYDKSYDQRYNAKPKNYVEVTPQKPKSLELKGITSNSFNDSFRQPKSQPVINDPFGRLNRMKPGVMKKEEPKGWLDYASDIYDDVAETVSDVSDKASEYFDLGVNWLERQYNKNSDAREESSFIKEPIITNSEYNINRPIITGDTLKIDEDRYYLPEVMDLNEFTFKSRNRNEITPIETEAASITAFNPFQDYETVKKSNFPKNSNFIGIDDSGNFKSGTIDQFSPSDKLSRVFKNNVESFATDDKGKMKFVRWSDNTMVDGKRVGNKDNPNSYVPLVNVIDDSGKKTVGTLNLLTKFPDDSGTFGQITGGRLILKQGDKQILVSGSINDVKNQFDKLAKNGPVEVFTLDNGSYSRGLRTYDQKITEDQLRDYDLQNVSGGHFLYSTGEKPRNKYPESRYQTPNVRTESDESYLQGHPLKNELQGVVLHQTAYKDKDLSGVHNQFMTPNKNSAHVLIGYDGERRVYADPEQVTFHGGQSSFKGRPNVNDFMLGLEFQGVAGEDRLTDAQIESAIEYLTPIIRKYNIPIEHITSHAAVAPGRKHDVSDADLDKIYKIIRDRLYTKKRNGGSVGINQLDEQPKKKLNQLLNFTNNPDKTNWLDKYQ